MLFRMMCAITLLLTGVAQSRQPVSAAEPARREWTVEGIRREALVAVPDSASSMPTPVVFAFHGHGGTMRHAARSFRFHEQWSEAIVVYMQG